MWDPRLQVQVDGSSYTAMNLGEGRWYWRVTPDYSEGSQEITRGSRIASFFVGRKAGLAAPVLLFPEQNDRVDAGGGEVRFSWKKEADAAGYTISIAPAAAPERPVVIREAPENSYFLNLAETPLQTGGYIWTVSFRDAEGNLSPSSESRYFTALPTLVAHEALSPPDDYTVVDTELAALRFTWNSSLSTVSRFQVSDTVDFARLILDEPAGIGAGEFRGGRLPAGIYYWRVSTPLESGGSLQTAPRRFTVGAVLSAPSPESPGGRLLLDASSPVVFRWRAVPGAAAYAFALYRGAPGSGGAPVYENPGAAENALSLSQAALEPGDYYWTVRALAPGGGVLRDSPAAASPFQLALPALITLESPASFTGLEAQRQPGTVRWRSSEPVGSSRFILSPNPDLSNPVSSVDDPPGTITLPRLTGGTWYWTIRAETPEGINITPSRPASFQVTAIPPLARPQAVHPERNAVIDPAYVRQNRSITFSWSPVAGANAYRFRLLRTGSSAPIVDTSPLPGTTYRFENMALLENGEFVWQVEALILGPGGTVERRGETAEYRFTVSIPRPGAPALNNPGTLYGL
jgi:hypothetical protein